jgi:hypothetical protein
MGVEIAPRACFIIGLISIISYLLIFLISLSCYHYAVNRYTRRIFLLLSLSVLFQLPWYANFLVTREPNGRIIYSFHMAASIFYFGSFSFVCFAWGDVLRAKNFELFFEYNFREKIRKVLILSNFLFIVLTLTMIGYCVTSKSLEQFFKSRQHYIFAGFDVIKNLLMGIFIAHFGQNLRLRLMNYYQGIIGRNTTSSHSAAAVSAATTAGSESRGNITRLAENTANLIRVNQKLVILVSISIFSFLLKALALIMWKRYTSPSEYEPPEPMEHRWVFWWIVFEIFPVALPAIAFCFTMGWPSKIFSSFVITFPEHVKQSRTLENVESDSQDRTRSSEIDEFRPSRGDRGNGDGSIQITSAHVLSPLARSLLRESYGEGGAVGGALEGYGPEEGGEDCFHDMNRLSDLIDIELDRDTFSEEEAGEQRQQQQPQREETKSVSSSTSGRFQFRFPSLSSTK